VRVERIPAWLADTNAYLVYSDSGQGMLIDAPPDPDTIGRRIAELDVAVVGILLTHGHVDHTGGAAKIAAGSPALVYAHPDDDFLTLHPTKQLKAIFGMTPPGSYEVPDSIQRLQHGQVLDIAGVSFEVRHTPGHTPGHCCFYVEQEGTLFTGDQLFAGSIGRTDLPGGSHQKLMESMARQVMPLDDDVTVLPGHGPETTIGRERRTNPFRGEWLIEM
jgi:glyoxylase-like metal-dependent hydrolase (beta-lactamase superfamily II)